ncbi:MAG: LytTR family transcriptional regulator DNA-binding domain-containing protein [Prevotellaceae bacterium]|jgi:DNA-binding LytR/AlgR family response regulator|nr:LytTR family transcriptional regulator DNA-binding domain-containing protein [Prevotellaceae bacterium]
MPLLENRIRIFIYAFIWVSYAILHAVSVSWFVAVPFGTLLVDALFHAILFAGLCVIMWIILKFSKYETLMPVQRILSYGTLAIIIVALGVGTGYFLDYVFLEEDEVLVLISTLPVKALCGLMLYVIFVLYFYVDLQHLEIEAETEAELETEQKQSGKPDSGQDESDDPDLLERILVKAKQQLKIIPVNDIIYFRSEGDYVMIISNDGKYLKEKTMKYFESHLPKSLFIRVHRSYIVNIEYISAIESYGKQNQQVLLRNGEWLKVSLAGYKALKFALR